MPVGSSNYTDIYAIVHPVFTLQSVDICRFQKHNISKMPNFQVFCLQKEHLLNVIFCVDSPAVKNHLRIIYSMADFQESK